ncbi:MAG: carbohydrate kinase [Lachnospiraceae bacterium]|nr:carbohydrate kinase [Lachnospiraceae bacterium]
MDIICAGEMLIDFTPGTTFYNYTANPGGAPANVAIETARNGVKTGFLGVMGKDDFGHLLMNTLNNNKVTALCPTLTEEATTTLAFVTLYEDGERSFTFVRKPGADMLLSKEHVLANKELIETTRLFHAGSFSLTSPSAAEAILCGMQLAKEQEHLVSFDVNYRDTIWENEDACFEKIKPLLSYIDILKISDEELHFVGGSEDAIPGFMKQHNISVVVETLGCKGSKVFFHGESHFMEGKKVNAVDATGAGDAFFGGFLSYLLLHKVNMCSDFSMKLLKDALSYANIAGCLCVQKPGGIPALPTREEILNMNPLGPS